MQVLIAAPAGYVGRSLLARFAEDGRVGLRVLTTDARRLGDDLRPGIDVVEADPFDRPMLDQAVRGIEVAFYPIRLLSLDPGLEERHREFARRFRDACIEAGVRRIVHLGAPGIPERPGSGPSLLPDVTGILTARSDRIQTLVLLPGIIIGPGSAFHEMAMSLVGRLPVLPLPRWTRSIQPFVSLPDVVEYLARAVFLEVAGDARIEIGEERISVAEFLRRAAKVRGTSPAMIPIPARIPRLSAAFLALATPFSYPLSYALVRRLSSPEIPPPVVPAAGNAGRLFHGFTPQSCEEAIRTSLHETGSADGEGRWTDSLAGVSFRPSRAAMHQARYRDERRQDFGTLSPAAVYRSVLALGGERGWFSFDLLWRVRGLADKLLGGFGTALGRRSPSELRAGDMLDVWRVVDLAADRRLLLQAQMRVFGEAWLEFRIEGTTLIQTAFYEPDGALGTLYWHAMLPFHALIFPDLLRGIIRRAGSS